MANVHTVAETTNLRAVHYAARIFDCVCDVDIDNGTFGYMEELAEGFSHIYNFKVGAKEGKQVLMAHNPEWTEDTSNRLNQRKDKFFIPAGTPFRAFVVDELDEVALSASAPEGAVMVGKIMRSRNMGSIITTAVRNYGFARKMFEVKVESLA